MRSIKSSVFYALVCLSTILPTAYSYPIDSTAVASVKYQFNQGSLQPISASVEHLASTKLDGVGANPSIDYEVDNPDDDPRPFSKQDVDGVQFLEYSYQFIPDTVHRMRPGAGDPELKLHIGPGSDLQFTKPEPGHPLKVVRVDAGHNNAQHNYYERHFEFIEERRWAGSGESLEDDVKVAVKTSREHVFPQFPTQTQPSKDSYGIPTPLLALRDPLPTSLPTSLLYFKPGIPT
ncbi:hypothetical protein EV360DRAFT_72041 [Lentinula raphanica]|nr:hypothetical protein EV360DRAFT_72041 [Lentinula raphanica]